MKSNVLCKEQKINAIGGFLEDQRVEGGREACFNECSNILKYGGIRKIIKVLR